MSKFFKLLFLVTLGAIVVIECERQLVSPIHAIDPSQTTAQFAQNALSDLADTAAEHEFIGLANAASGVAEVLAIDDGTTSVQPTFSKLVELADNASAFEWAFVDSGCEIGMQKFAEASMDAVKAYTIRDTAEMEQALQNLAQVAIAMQTVLKQLPAHNSFTPFAFGYGRGDPYYFYKPYPYMAALQGYMTGPGNGYVLGAISIEYDEETPPGTREFVFEFLTSKGYDPVILHDQPYVLPDALVLPDDISLGAPIDPILLGAELINIPGVVSVTPVPIVHTIPQISNPPHISIKIIGRVAARYNQAWCQGNLDADAIDSILIEESGLDFFDYAFVRNLANIYAAENPEAAERIRTNRFCLRSIAIRFLEIYLPVIESLEYYSQFHSQDSKKFHAEILEQFRQVVSLENYSQDSKKTHAEILEQFQQAVRSQDSKKIHDHILEQFRQSIRTGSLSIELRIFGQFYLGTAYWKQLVADHLNNNRTYAGYSFVAQTVSLCQKTAYLLLRIPF